MARGLGSWGGLSLPASLIGRRPSSSTDSSGAARRSRAAWVLAAGALWCLVGGLAALRSGSVLLGKAPDPTMADAASALAYLSLISGTILLAWHPLPTGVRMRTAADYLMVLSAAATVSWSFIIGPTFQLTRLGLGGQVANATYAGLDLVLVLCLLLVASHWQASPMRPALTFLGVAIFTVLACHTVWAYGMTHGQTHDAAVFNALCSLGYFSAAIAGIAAHLGRQSPPVSGEELSAAPGPGTPALWRYLLPYALLPGVGAALIYQAHLHTPGYVETGGYVAASIMIEVMLAHQFLAYRELTSYANRSARLESLAAADPVTGLPNQRSVVTVLDTLLRRAAEEETLVSVLFLDLDRFKSLNDRFGHAAGDRALREFAAVVRTALRAEDVFGRWGGEEFVALLPDTEATAAHAVAQRVCESVAGHVFRTVGGTSVTCSIGVASWPGDGKELGVLVEAADTAMYAAKQQGRNRVVVAGGAQPVPAAAPPGLVG